MHRYAVTIGRWYSGYRIGHSVRVIAARNASAAERKAAELYRYPASGIVSFEAVPYREHVARTLREAGVTIRKVEGEYRVNVKGGSEDTAYYTNDLDDALRTGLTMGARRGLTIP